MYLHMWPWSMLPVIRWPYKSGRRQTDWLNLRALHTSYTWSVLTFAFSVFGSVFGLFISAQLQWVSTWEKCFQTWSATLLRDRLSCMNIGVTGKFSTVKTFLPKISPRCLTSVASLTKIFDPVIKCLCILAQIVYYIISYHIYTYFTGGVFYSPIQLISLQSAPRSWEQ